MKPIYESELSARQQCLAHADHLETIAHNLERAAMLSGAGSFNRTRCNERAADFRAQAQQMRDMAPADPLAHLERAAADQRRIHGPALYDALQEIAAADEAGHTFPDQSET